MNEILMKSQSIRQLSRPCSLVLGYRTAATATKREGDISSIFLSLSGAKVDPLPERFARIKRQLVFGHEDQVLASWSRLLKSLKDEIQTISRLGSKVIPEIEFREMHTPSASFTENLKKGGVAVIRGVLPEDEALALKADVRSYIKDNPQTKAFPPDRPSVFELYFSPSQMRARAHPNLLKAQQFLMSFWHSKDREALVSTEHPLSYADRIRARPPGDASFALGPHVDGGSVERWEENGYGLGKVYDAIWKGQWEEYDPWETSCRLPVVSDLYNGAGACSMFRMFQGWLSMSTTGANEGTLLVNPLLSKATAYYLLRPLFALKAPSHSPSDLDIFNADNWELNVDSSTILHGAALGQCQELNSELHPHLDLEKSMVHVPMVRPGDFVAWHCDTIHAVDKVHTGNSDSSVFYIPVCPLTTRNAEYLRTQREAFHKGSPGPDFPGGIGESIHVGRITESEFRKNENGPGLQAMGFEKWDEEEMGLSKGERKVVKEANRILGHTA